VLVDQGKVLYVGSSNFAGWHLALANGTAAARHLLGLVSEQSIRTPRGDWRLQPSGESGLGAKPRPPR